MSGGGRRLERVKDLLREVGSEVLRQIKDPAVASELVSITEVQLTPDLSYARFRVSILADPDRQREVLQGLTRAAGFFRREIKLQVHMKKIPAISFELDDSLERSARMLELLAANPVRPLSADEADSGSAEIAGT